MSIDDKLAVLRAALAVVSSEEATTAWWATALEKASHGLGTVIGSLEEERGTATNAVSPDDYTCCNCGDVVYHNGRHWTGETGIRACSLGCHEALRNLLAHEAQPYSDANYDLDRVVSE